MLIDSAVKTGYFINTNNYMPCKYCSSGYDEVTMLCSEHPYYYHIPRNIIEPNPPRITGFTLA